MKTVEHEGWLEVFDHEFAENGFLQLSYHAKFDDGHVLCAMGRTKPHNPGVKVCSATDAYAYISALRRAESAARWNSRNPGDDVVDAQAFKERVRDALAWASKPLNEGTAFSHHGIHMKDVYVASGRPIQLDFNPSMRAFYAYDDNIESDAGLWDTWGAPEYDPKIVCDLIAEVVGNDPIDEWNDLRSMVFPLSVDATVAAAFHPEPSWSDGSLTVQPGEPPRGWR